LSHQQIDNEHLLAALLEQEMGVVPDSLLRTGVDLESLHRRLMADPDKLPAAAVLQGAESMSLTFNAAHKPFVTAAILADAGGESSDDAVVREHGTADRCAGSGERLEGGDGQSEIARPGDEARRSVCGMP
jgi:ATP-dependent Clp protease ATP-binding subunit ClpA